MKTAIMLTELDLKTVQPGFPMERNGIVIPVRNTGLVANKRATPPGGRLVRRVRWEHDEGGSIPSRAIHLNGSEEPQTVTCS